MYDLFVVRVELKRGFALKRGCALRPLKTFLMCVNGTFLLITKLPWK